MLDDYLFHHFFQINRQLSKKLDRQLAPLGIYRSQWAIIFLLKEYGPITQAQICYYLSVEAPTITRTISRLEKADLVERKTGIDKREKLIQLTKKAENTYPTWKQEIEKFEARVLENIPKKEQQDILDILQKINNNLSKGE